MRFHTWGWAPDADLLLMEVSRGRDDSAVMIYDPAADTSIDLNVPDVTNLLGWRKTPANLWFETGLDREEVGRRAADITSAIAVLGFQFLVSV